MACCVRADVGDGVADAACLEGRGSVQLPGAATTPQLPDRIPGGVDDLGPGATVATCALVEPAADTSLRAYAGGVI